VYNGAQTPYLCVRACMDVLDDGKEKLEKLFQTLDLWALSAWIPSQPIRGEHRLERINPSRGEGA